MTGGWKAAALVAVLMLAGGGCTIGSGTSTANNTPAPSPSEQTSPSSSPSSSPSGNETPSSSASSSPSPSPSSAALAILPTTYQLGEAGLAYAGVTLSATGGTPPYGWAVTGGALPPGLGLSSAGKITGKPTAAGHFNFSVQVTDAASATATGSGSIGIYAALTLGALCTAACGVEEGCTMCGNFGSANGGVAPYSLAVTAGALPPGMGLSGLTLTGAFPISGTGAWSLTVQVTDKFGATGSVSANFVVFQHIAFGGGSMNCFFGGCTVNLPYTESTAGDAVSASVVLSAYSQTCVSPPGCPPPPYSYSGKAASGTLTITLTYTGGNPAWMSNAWTGTLTVVLTDSHPCGPGNCSTGPVPVSVSVQAG